VESKKKNKMGPLCREGPLAKDPLPRAFDNYRSATRQNFPSSGLPSFAEHSCRKHSAKKFFLKIKNRLCRRPLHRTLGTRFFQKNRKTIFADGFCPGPSAQVFFLKNRKTIFVDGFCPGLSAHNFKKIPLFADGPDSRPSAKKFSKTVILNPR
jgi:hypothetical protein